MWLCYFVVVVVQSLSRVWLCDSVGCSMPAFPVLHYLLEFAQAHVPWVGDDIQPSHPLPPPSPFAFNLSQDQGLFHWVSPSHQVAKVLRLQLQHQSFQWYLVLISFRIDWFELLAVYSRDSQESSPASQFEGISSLALCLLYSPALTTDWETQLCLVWWLQPQN